MRNLHHTPGIRTRVVIQGRAGTVDQRGEDRSKSRESRGRSVLSDDISSMRRLSILMAPLTSLRTPTSAFSHPSLFSSPTNAGSVTSQLTPTSARAARSSSISTCQSSSLSYGVLSTFLRSINETTAQCRSNGFSAITLSSATWISESKRQGGSTSPCRSARSNSSSVKELNPKTLL